MSTREFKIAGIAVVATALLAAAIVFFLPHKGGPGPGPGPEPGPAGSGAWLVVMVDDTAPSIPIGLILQSNQMRALAVAGKLSICSIQEEYTKAKGYDKILGPVGGAPAMLILDHDGGAVYSGRLPTDRKVFEQLVGKYIAGCPPPLPDTPVSAVLNRGGEMKLAKTANGEEFVEEGGEKRMLVAFSDPQRFAALPRYAEHLPVFPQSEWYEINRSNIFGAPDFILDQDGHGSCVAQGWVGALRRARIGAGMKDVNLSPAFLYAQINGGRDQGAVISDGIAALKNVGTCTFDLVGQNPIYMNQMPSGAKEQASRFKLLDAYRCNSWEEVVSALLTGRFYPVYGYQVGNNFGRFDQYGVAGHDNGPGNHCNFAEGLRKLPDGRWVLDDVNSWGKWGPFKNGHVYLDKQHLFGGGDQPNVCVVRTPGRDPKEVYSPPALKP